MAGYKLATYEGVQGPRAGAVINDLVYDVAALTGQPKYASVLDVLADWDTAHKLLDAAAKAPKGDGKPVKQTKLLAPVRWPGTIYCAGANYQDHAEEMWKAAGQPPQPDPHELGLKPWFFIKAARSVTDPDAKVSISNYSKKMDWEAELAVVIGRRAKHVSKADALEYVAGYSAINDISLRGPHRVAHPIGEPFQWDWLASKGSDRSTPLGPGIRPAFQVANPQLLDLRLWVNGRLKQEANTSDMVIDVAGLIAAASHLVTLEPGDVIATGTPDGVGLPRGEFLHPGDVVEMEVGDFGRLTNPVVVEEA